MSEHNKKPFLDDYFWSPNNFGGKKNAEFYISTG